MGKNCLLVTPGSGRIDARLTNLVQSWISRKVLQWVSMAACEPLWSHSTKQSDKANHWLRSDQQDLCFDTPSGGLAQLLFSTVIGMDYKNISPIESLWEDYVHLKRVFGITIWKPQFPKNIYPFHLSPIISKLLHIHTKFMMIMFHIKNHRKLHKICKF